MGRNYGFRKTYVIGEGYGGICRLLKTFKGEGLKGIKEPLCSIGKASNRASDVSLSRYHNAFLHYKLEGLVRDYFHEEQVTSDRCTWRNFGASPVSK